MTEDRQVPDELVSTASTGAGAGPQEIIARYRLLQKIGEGGMGEVFMAEQRHPVRRRVALKVIKRGLDTRQVVARFEAERQVLAMMDHPCIAKVFDAGETPDGRPFFVMEYVKGLPITTYCDHERLGTWERLELFRRVCDGVQHAHQKAVIHRDLKPSNVLVTIQDEKAEPKIIDFGLAKAIEHRLTERTLFTELGQIVGTPEYMSPEQAEMTPQDVDTRTDIYSLGVVLYELLVGALPFDSQALREAGYEEIRRRIREEEPSRPSTRVTRLDPAQQERVRRRGIEPALLARQLRGDLDWITMRALEKDRRRRYQTASDLAEDITRHLRHEPVVAGPPGARYRLGKFIRRNRVGVTAAALVLASLVAGLLASTIGFVEARRQRDLAREATILAEEQAFHANLAASGAAFAMDEIESVRRHLDTIPPRFRNWEWRYLDAESDNSEAVLQGDGGYVNAVAISPDGRHLASGSGDGTVRLWDSRAGQNLSAWRGHGRWVSSVAFSPDGTRLASAGGDTTIRVWDVSTLAEQAVLRDHKDRVNAVAFSPDGSRLASGSDDGTIRLWNAATGKELVVLRGHDDRVFSVAFSPDGLRLASGSQVENAVRLWDATTGQELGVVPGVIGAVFMVAFSPDGKLLAGALKDGTVRLWEATTLAEHAVLRGHKDDVGGVAFSPDGRLLASCSVDRTIRLWDIATKVEVTTLHGHTGFVVDVAFSPNGRHLASAGWDGTLRMWDVDAAETLQAFRFTPAWESSYESLAFSPDGTRVAVMAGAWENPEYNVGEIWDVVTGERLAVLRGHEDWGNTIVFNQDGTRLASAATDRTIRIWQADTGECRMILRVPEQGVRRIAFSPDGSRLASGSYDGTLRLWDPDSGAELEILRGHRAQVASLAFSPDGSRLASVSWDSTARLWDVTSGSQLAVVALQSRGYCIVFSPDGSYLAWSAILPAGSPIHICDASLTSEEAVLEGHEYIVYSLAFSPDGTRLASAAADGTVRIWETQTGRSLQVLRGHDGWVSSVAFSPEGNLLASASHDGSVRLWHTEALRSRARKRQEVLAAGEPAEAIVTRLWREPHDLAQIGQRLRADPSLGLAQRQAALNLLLRRSTRIQSQLDSLYARLLFTDDVVAALEADEHMDPAWRDKAVRSARTRGDQPVRLERHSWHLVRSPDRTTESYEIGLRGAETAKALTPEDTDCLSTLGTALYRLGRCEDALGPLRRSEELRRERVGKGGARALAVLAMSLARLNQPEAARATFQRLEEVQNDPNLNWLLEERDEALVEECKEVLKGQGAF